MMRIDSILWKNPTETFGQPNIYICITESVYRTEEKNTTLQINYTSKKIELKK